MLAKNPDTICSDACPTGTVALIAKQARELGFQGPIYNPTGVVEAKSLWETAGKGSDNVVVPRIWAKPPNDVYAQLEKKYKEKYKEDMLALVPEMYPLLFWLVQAMQAAKSVDSWEVTQALRASSFDDHPFGKASWGGEKTYGIASQIEYPIPLSILKDGKWEEVMVVMGEFP
jgi:ABC-type branched-subunit amino acid transport system substrate-binding protein